MHVKPTLSPRPHPLLPLHDVTTRAQPVYVDPSLNRAPGTHHSWMANEENKDDIDNCNRLKCERNREAYSLASHQKIYKLCKKGGKAILIIFICLKYDISLGKYYLPSRSELGQLDLGSHLQD